MKMILIRMIQFYQKYLSPMKSTKCPYYPSCSQYGLEAIQKYGAVKGSILAAWTVKSPEQLKQLETEYDWFIFEGFMPTK